jgi:hypothetical protein
MLQEPRDHPSVRPEKPRFGFPKAVWTRAGIALAVLLFAYFVWPTPWKCYFYHSEYWAKIVRVNRFTGEAEYVLPKRP